MTIYIDKTQESLVSATPSAEAVSSGEEKGGDTMELDTIDTGDTTITTIKPENLEFSTFDPLKDNLESLDLAQSDGRDPLQVKEFAKELSTHESIHDGIRYNKTFVVKHNSMLIAFFTVRLSVITSKGILEKDKEGGEARGNATASPALLMEKIGIDKNFRCFGIGKYVCLFCLGMAQRINEVIPCPFFAFKTTRSLAEKIYGPKYFFKWQSLSNKEIVWAYRRVA
jgi:hypothetical protein